MVRQIRPDQIDDVMAEAVQKLVRTTTLEWSARVKKATPVDTGRLRTAWQTDVSKPYTGTILNNVEYAEPVPDQLEWKKEQSPALPCLKEASQAHPPQL